MTIHNYLDLVELVLTTVRSGVDISENGLHDDKKKCTYCGQWNKIHTTCEFCGASVE